MLKPGYLDFYRRARRLLRRLVREESFDLIHQYEPFAPRYPSPAAGLGVPLILGPVGGGVDTPAGFRDEVEQHMAWYTRLRAFDRFRFRHDPWLRNTYAAADLVLGIAPYVQELLAPVPVKRFACMHETGVESLPPAVERAEPAAGHLRLLYVVRIVRTKGVRDGVRGSTGWASRNGTSSPARSTRRPSRSCARLRPKWIRKTSSTPERRCHFSPCLTQIAEL